jgi:hypothetical protein
MRRFVGIEMPNTGSIIEFINQSLFLKRMLPATSNERKAVKARIELDPVIFPSQPFSPA